MTMNEKIKNYPKTEFFEAIDTIGVPHPFCITPKHVAHASDNYSGMLGDAAIQSLETKLGRPTCGVQDCNLTYDQHEQALLVKCKTKDEALTKAYLESIVEQCQKDGFAGFTLMLDKSLE